jgi:clan AA aspartic protease
MGRVTTEVTVENLEDLWTARSGQLAPDRVRRISASDALVDTGASTLSLPIRFIQQLGLKPCSQRRVVTSAGVSQTSMYDAVRLTIQGRDCTVDVLEVPDSVPILVGQIPLEALDLVVDPVSRRLIGNPAHGGEQILELL